MIYRIMHIPTRQLLRGRFTTEAGARLSHESMAASIQDLFEVRPESACVGLRTIPIDNFVEHTTDS